MAPTWAVPGLFMKHGQRIKSNAMFKLIVILLKFEVFQYSNATIFLKPKV